jgi:hypothetical protein
MDGKPDPTVSHSHNHQPHHNFLPFSPPSNLKYFLTLLYSYTFYSSYDNKYCSALYSVAKGSLYHKSDASFTLTSPAEHIAMSSSITIPTRQAYCEGGKVGSSSSSSSCYSTSPQTPQQKGKSPMSTPSKSAGHNRRPSMLSESSPYKTRLSHHSAKRLPTALLPTKKTYGYGILQITIVVECEPNRFH